VQLSVKLEPLRGSLYPAGSLTWDSETGELSGDLAAVVGSQVEQARKWGKIAAGPQFACDFPIGDPLHRPAEMAAILLFLKYRLPAELERFTPEFPDPLIGMSAVDRREIVF
jgi:hypothetical protein